MKKLDRQTRVLITGGCGFIGRHLIAHLLSKTDWDIVSLDSLTYAADTTLTPLSGVRHYYHDLRSPVPEVLKEKIGFIDHFFNLASESFVDRSITDPVPFVLNNVSLALHALEYARELMPKGLKSFLQISTDEVFGPAEEGYFHKEDDVHCPSNPYSASKSAQEQIATSYWRTYGVPVIITRTMNNFGEGQHREKFLPVVIKHLSEGKPPPVYGENKGNGWESGSRVWLHAKNHADALLYLSQNHVPNSYPNEKRPSQFHVSGDREITNLEMIQLIADILGVEAKWKWVDFHGCRPGHDKRYALDGSKLRKLGWNPPMSLDESLVKTVEWYKT